ncbi:MAG: hypothetical protein PHZ00_05740 [Candidatus Peribacteraceae bacterium]|nr:hypothetical protein [Candidatus Peribacteraceae bacterium]
MPTTKRRLNLALPPDLDIVIGKLAKRDNVPQATKAIYLLALALELEEDIVLDALASERDNKGVKFISHDKAWA